MLAKHLAVVGIAVIILVGGQCPRVVMSRPLEPEPPVGHVTLLSDHPVPQFPHFSKERGKGLSTVPSTRTRSEKSNSRWRCYH